MSRRSKCRNKFGEWLMYAPPFVQKELADMCGTSLAYLRQLGNGHRVNPKVKLAVSISEATAELNKKHGLGYLTHITVKDLAEIKSRED